MGVGGSIRVRRTDSIVTTAVGVNTPDRTKTPHSTLLGPKNRSVHDRLIRYDDALRMRYVVLDCVCGGDRSFDVVQARVLRSLELFKFRDVRCVGVLNLQVVSTIKMTFSLEFDIMMNLCDDKYPM